MPIDRMFSDPMLGTFRTMAAECREKKLSGPAFDAMIAELDKMERLAVEMSDFGAFSARLMQEGCFTNFSTHYSAVLAEAARAETASSPDSDAVMLERTLRAYEEAAAQEGALPVLQTVIALGRSGLSYPAFLREMVERGLDRALEGGGVAREGLESDLRWARHGGHPLEIALRQALLDAFDELAVASPFGVPDPLAFELRRQRLEWEAAPALARWKAVTRRWQNLLELVHDWLDAFTRFAPADARWADPEGPAATQRNIRRTQQLGPYRLREHERIFAETCGLRWADVPTHETFRVAWDTVDIAFSEAKLAQIVAAHPHCRPGGRPPPELVAAAEELARTGGAFRTTERQARADRPPPRP